MLMNNKLFVSFEYPAVQRDAIVVQQAQRINSMASKTFRSFVRINSQRYCGLSARAL